MTVSARGTMQAAVWPAVQALLAAAVFTAVPCAAVAQTTDSLRARFRVPRPEMLDVAYLVARRGPGSSAGSPTAFGPDWGDAYVGVGFTHRARFAQERSFPESADGAVAVGLGLGDARRWAGLDVNVAFFSTVRRGWGNRMGVSFLLHRLFPGAWGLGLGLENALRRGPVDSEPSLYLVASKVWTEVPVGPLRSVTASLGLGDGRFRSERDVLAGRKRAGVFGSLGLHVADPVSLIADWTGQDLTLALAAWPLQAPGLPAAVEGIPLMVTVGLADLVGTAGDGVRFVAAAGLGFRWNDRTEAAP